MLPSDDYKRSNAQLAEVLKSYGEKSSKGIYATEDSDVYPITLGERKKKKTMPMASIDENEQIPEL
jgi:hypothetical protein